VRRGEKGQGRGYRIGERGQESGERTGYFSSDHKRREEKRKDRI
jgi:hypothetical protein